MARSDGLHTVAFEGTSLLAALPVAIYTTDPDGRLTFYNDAAADLWGRRPVIGTERWCGFWRLYWPDLRPLAHEDGPLAVVLREGHPVREVEIVAERPDGTRVAVLVCPRLLRDDAGVVIGAINTLVDLSDRKQAEGELGRLASIVSSSDDAIVSKTLEGRVSTWNGGAERIFGYSADEMIGQPIIRIIPPELRHEEVDILARLRRGERIAHFDTVRLTKDGRRIDVSLTVSPVRDRAGTIIGASKIARDISERKRAEFLQRLLFDELNHRVKNTLATIQAIASQSLRRAATPEIFVEGFSGRIQALARAHDLLVEGNMVGAGIAELVREQVVFGAPDGLRIAASGPPVLLEAHTAVQLGLVLHELATNARKYGALSVPSGRLSITWKLQDEARRELLVDWSESGVPNLQAPRSPGFGTTMIERSLKVSGGEATLRYGRDGLSCRIRLPLRHVDEVGRRGLGGRTADAADTVGGGPRRQVLRGTRVLIVEDEVLVALELESQLAAAGCAIVGPAGTLEQAERLLEEETFAVAVLDANLGGQPVDRLAAALKRKGVPFAFATGYGREALPLGYQDVPLLAKPFRSEDLLELVATLIAQDVGGGRVAKPQD